MIENQHFLIQKPLICILSMSMLKDESISPGWELDVCVRTCLLLLIVTVIYLELLRNHYPGGMECEGSRQSFCGCTQIWPIPSSGGPRFQLKSERYPFLTTIRRQIVYIAYAYYIVFFKY